MKRRIVAALALPLIIAACGQNRDAASEEPVRMKPGLYIISSKGVGMMGMTAKTGGKEPREKEICLRSDGVSSWPRMFVRASIALDDDCAIPTPKRTGNAFEGTVYCPLDADDASGEAKLVYTGTIDEQRSDLSARMVLDIKASSGSNEDRMKIAAAGTLLKAIEVSMSAERKGDCS